MTDRANLLVPLDGSAAADRALQTARDLARAMDAEVVLLHVLDPPEGRAGMASSDEAVEYLRGRQETVETPARYRVQEGRTAIQGILEAVRDEDAVLVVLATHGRSAHPESPLGSVARELPRLCPKPVVLVGPSVWNQG
jgi:nucleotide-binding universal stress UspA family protein